MYDGGNVIQIIIVLISLTPRQTLEDEDPRRVIRNFTSS